MSQLAHFKFEVVPDTFTSTTTGVNEHIYQIDIDIDGQRYGFRQVARIPVHESELECLIRKAVAEFSNQLGKVEP